MVNRRELEAVAAEVLGVSPDASVDEAQSAYRNLVSDYHPDTSDYEDAQERFQAIDQAKDVLKGEPDFYDPENMKSIRDRMGYLVDEGRMQEIAREERRDRGFSSPGGSRKDPGDYDVSDFMGTSKEERAEMAQELALGVEALIIYRSVEGIYERGYGRDDYFQDINEYIDDKDPEEVVFSDYWEATKEGVIPEASEDVFVAQIKNIEQNLQREFAEGMTLREVAGTVATFIVRGDMNLGDIDRFVGTGIYGGDDIFGGGGGVFGDDDIFARGDPIFKGRDTGTRRSDFYGDSGIFDR